MSTGLVQAGVPSSQGWLGKQMVHHHSSSQVRCGDTGSGNLLSKDGQVMGELLLQKNWHCPTVGQQNWPPPSPF